MAAITAQQTRLNELSFDQVIILITNGENTKKYV